MRKRRSRAVIGFIDFRRCVWGIGVRLQEYLFLKRNRAILVYKKISFIQDGGVTKQSRRFVFTVRYFVCI